MATLTAATVAINLVAGTDGFTRGMQQATRSAESWEKSLQSQVRAMQMGQDEARMYELALRGADLATRDRIRGLLSEKKAIEDAAAAERQAAEASADAQRKMADAAAQSQRQWTRAMLDGRAVYEQTRTPMEQHRIRLAELQGMLKSGAINQQTFDRASAQSAQQSQASAGSLEKLVGQYAMFGETLGPVGLAVGLAAAAFAAAAVAGVVLAGVVAKLTVNGLETINALVEQAAAVGVTTDAMVKLDHAADMNASSGEAMNTALRKMTQTLGDAVRSGGAGADAVAALGLDLNKVANESPDAAFVDVADALSKIHNPAERASLAVDIFGKSAQQLGGVLGMNKQQFADAGAQAASFGIAINQVDANKVDAAMDAVGNLGKILEGVGEQMAVQLAPAITAVAEKIRDFALAGGSVGDEMQVVFGAVGEVILDVANKAELAYRAFSFLFGTVFSSAVAIVKELAVDVYRLGQLFEAITGKKVFAGLTDATGGRDLSNMIAEMWGNWQKNAQAAGEAAAKANAFRMSADAQTKAMQDAKKAADDAFDSAQKFVQQIEAQADTAGLDDTDKALYELSHLAGAMPEHFDRIRAAMERIKETKAAQEQTEQFNKLQEAASQVFESTRTPTEKYAEHIDQLNDMLAAGVLSWDTYGRAVQQANLELAKTGPKGADQANLGDTPQLAANEIRFLASIPGLSTPGQDDSKADVAETADNTKDTADNTNRIADLIDSRLSFDVVG